MEAQSLLKSILHLSGRTGQRHLKNGENGKKTLLIQVISYTIMMITEDYFKKNRPLNGSALSGCIIGCV